MDPDGGQIPEAGDQPLGERRLPDPGFPTQVAREVPVLREEVDLVHS